MSKEKSQKGRRVGKKYSLKMLTCQAHLITVDFMGLAVESQRESLEKFTAFEKLNFYLMELNYKKSYAEALLAHARILPRKQKKAQKEESAAVFAEIPGIRAKITEAVPLVKPECEDRANVLKELVRLFSFYEDSDDKEAKSVILSQKELFGFTDRELEEAKLVAEKELDIGGADKDSTAGMTFEERREARKKRIEEAKARIAGVRSRQTPAKATSQGFKRSVP